MALTGSETLQVLGQNPSGVPAASTFQTTTSEIAALASTQSSPLVSTSITTVGNGTLTAAGLVGGQIVRTGPVAAYSDATATAVAIVAALPGYVAGETFLIRLKNATAFTQTITAGVGVTLPSTVIIPAFSVGNYFATVTSATAVTLTHMSTVPIATGTTLTSPAITTLCTVGAGTLLVANFTGGYTVRAGSQSGTPFTDTTDTATNILAANATLVNKIGTAVPYYYSNTTNAVATLTGGTGVTVSGITAVPAGEVATYLITYTAAATLTMVGIGLTNNISTAMALAGSSSGQTIIQPTAAAAGTLTLPAVTGTVASTSGSNLFIADVKRCTAQKDTITTALADVTGLTAQALVAGATYQFRCVLPGTADGTSGIAYAFNYTTATLTSIQAVSKGYTATALSAVQYTTTTTTQALLFDKAAVITLTEIEGTMVVNAAGTLALQVSTHTGTTTASTYLGATMEFVRIA